MLNFKAIDHININVSNLRNSIDFYQKLFNFKVHEEGVSPMSGAPYAIIGLSHKGFLAIYESKNLNRSSRVNHLGFNIEDFDNAVKKIKENGIRVADYGVVDYPDSKSIYIFDPDDNEIELSSKFGGGL